MSRGNGDSFNQKLKHVLLAGYECQDTVHQVNLPTSKGGQPGFMMDHFKKIDSGFTDAVVTALGAQGVQVQKVPTGCTGRSAFSFVNFSDAARFFSSQSARTAVCASIAQQWNASTASPTKK